MTSGPPRRRPVAQHAAAHGRGVLVAFPDRLHAARWVTKTSTFRVDAFTSEPFGPVGIVAEGRVRLGSAPRPLPPFEIPSGPPARVAVVTAGIGDGLAVLHFVGAAQALRRLPEQAQFRLPMRKCKVWRGPASWKRQRA